MTDSGPGPVAPTVAAPGRARRHRRPGPDVRWELLGCALDGHALVGTDAREVVDDDHPLVRAAGEVRWHRCLRCDAWVPQAAPEAPTRERVPSRDEIEVPLRGRPLRDRYVLRVIAVERGLHVLFFGLLTVAVFVFAAHQQSLRDDYTRVLNDLQQFTGGPVGNHGILSDLNRLFNLKTSTLRLIGAGIGAYAVINAVETYGLWRDRRWAEYLTFVESCVLVPYEIYELANGVSVLKLLTFLINLAILVYLALGHRLFGLRGGRSAIEARRAATRGWPAIDATTPPHVPAGGDHPRAVQPAGIVTGAPSDPPQADRYRS